MSPDRVCMYMAKHLGERGRQAQQRRQRRAGQHRLLEGAHPGVRQVHQRAQRRAGQAAPAPRVHLRARAAHSDAALRPPRLASGRTSSLPLSRL